VRLWISGARIAGGVDWNGATEKGKCRRAVDRSASGGGTKVKNPTLTIQRVGHPDGWRRRKDETTAGEKGGPPASSARG
jgi:hypothetical protein